MTLADQTRQFWDASYFYRRCGKHHAKLAINVLEQVAADAPPRLQDRAVTVLVEIDNDQLTRNDQR